MDDLPTTISDILHKQEAGRQALFRIYTDLRRQAQDSEDYELHRLVGEAYTAFMRAFLTQDARRLLEIEDENVRLRAELQRWRSGIDRIEP